MAQQVKVGVTLDDGQFREGIQEDEKELQGFSREVGTAAEEISASAAQQVAAAASMANYKKELRNSIKELQNLRMAFNDMNDEQKNSEVGRAMLEQMNQLRDRAAELTDYIGDMNQEIRNLASDTVAFDAFKEGVSVGRDVLGAFAATLEFAGEESEDLNAMIKRLTQIYTVSNALISVTNALQAQSALMCKTRAAQEAMLAAGIKLRAAAEGKGVIVTKAATAAQALFNKIAMMNPYVLIAMGCVAAVAGLAALVSWLDSASDAEKKQAEQLEQLSEETKQYYSEYNTAMGQTMGSYQKLRTEWQNLTSEQEKSKWIKENKKAFHELGIEVDDTAEADKVFVEQTSQVIRAFDLRAKAAAYAARAQKRYTEALNNVSEKYNLNDVLDYDEVRELFGNSFNLYTTKNQMSGEGTGFLGTGAFSKDRYRINQQGLEYLEQQALDRAGSQSERDYQTSIDLQREADQLMASLGVRQHRTQNEEKDKPTRKTGSSARPAVTGSLADLEQRYSTYQKDYKEGHSKDSQEEYLRKVEEFETKIRDKKIELGIEADLDTIPGLEKEIKRLKEKYSQGLLTISPEEAEETIKTLEARLKDMKVQAHIEPSPDSVTAMEKTLAKLQSDYANGWLPDMNPADFKKTVDALQKQIESRKIELGIIVNPKITKRDELDKESTNVIKSSREATSTTVSSFTQAVETVIPKGEGQSDEEKTSGRLDELRTQMDAIDEQMKKLDEQKKKYEEAGLAGSAAYQSVANQIIALNAEEIDLNKQKADMEALGLAGTDAYQKIIDRIEQLTGERLNLEDQKKALEDLGDIGSEAYQQILQEMGSLQGQTITLGEEVVDLTQKQKKAAAQKKAWNGIADAIGSTGDALGALSQIADDDPGLQVASLVAQAIAQVMVGYATATSQAASMGPWAWIAFAATGLVTALATIS